MQEFAYVYNGGTLMQMVIETTEDDGAPVTEVLSFSYDASGIPMSVVYNGTAYFYTVNLQGDVWRLWMPPELLSCPVPTTPEATSCPSPALRLF